MVPFNVNGLEHSGRGAFVPISRNGDQSTNTGKNMWYILLHLNAWLP